jgi:hypothetical protein
VFGSLLAVLALIISFRWFSCEAQIVYIPGLNSGEGMRQKDYAKRKQYIPGIDSRRGMRQKDYAKRKQFIYYIICRVSTLVNGCGKNARLVTVKIILL